MDSSTGAAANAMLGISTSRTQRKSSLTLSTVLSTVMDVVVFLSVSVGYIVQVSGTTQRILLINFSNYTALQEQANYLFIKNKYEKFCELFLKHLKAESLGGRLNFSMSLELL